MPCLLLLKLELLQYPFLKVCTTTHAQLHDLVDQFITDSSGHTATWNPMVRHLDYQGLEKIVTPYTNHRSTDELKKSDTKLHVLCGSIHMKFKNRQVESMVTEVQLL